MAGAYWLGVDVGTTYTAAAVHRADGRTEVVQLASRGAAIPSVLLLRADGELLTGDTARRRAQAEPDRVAAGFKRRVGDPVPILVGGSPFAAEALVAKLLRWVVDVVTEREGGPPEGLAVTHPANWGPYKLDLLGNALRTAGVERFTLLSEPEAAARHYAEHGSVPDGALVAVYDLGGGTFDACVLRRRHDGGFELLGRPEGIERLGGLDLDEAVFGHVQRSAPDLFDGVDAEDPSVRAALVRLRDDCTEAKEQLSADVDAAITVLLPGRPAREVRLTRGEFEALVRPSLTDTIGCVQRALASAGVTADELHAVLLVGGSSRVPLVAQLVSSGLERPVAVDADPKLTVAQGAALAAHAAAEAPAAAPAEPEPAPVLQAAAEPAPEPEPDPAPVAEPQPAPAPEPEPVRAVVGAGEGGGGSRHGRPRWLVPAGVAAAVVAAVVGVLLLGGDDGDPGTEDQEGPSSTAGDATTTSAPDDGTPDSTPDDGSAAFTFPATPFVHLTSAELLDDGAIAVGFETNFAMSGADSFAGPNRHVHLFWDVDDRARSGDVAAQAGTNGDPEPCNCWFAYGGPPPAVDQSLLHVDLRPEGATAVCALVATADDDPSGGHAIADVDGDGVPDPGSGDCIDVTALFAGTPGDTVSN